MTEFIPIKGVMINKETKELIMNFEFPTNVGIVAAEDKRDLSKNHIAEEILDKFFELTEEEQEALLLRIKYKVNRKYNYDEDD